MLWFWIWKGRRFGARQTAEAKGLSCTDLFFPSPEKTKILIVF